MPETQRSPVGTDIKASVVQQNFEQLFEVAHSHQVRTSAPASNEGAINDIVPVILDSIPYLYIKFPTVGWKRVLAS